MSNYFALVLVKDILSIVVTLTGARLQYLRAGQTVEVLSDFPVEDSRMRAVSCGKETALVFASDLESRTERVKVSSASPCDR